MILLRYYIAAVLAFLPQGVEPGNPDEYSNRTALANQGFSPFLFRARALFVCG